MSVNREPLYSCEGSEECAGETSYPANMLRVHEDKLWCKDCWTSPWACDYDDKLLWYDLPEFVPDENLSDLLDAADRVCFEAEFDDWSCMPSIQGCKALADALKKYNR